MITIGRSVGTGGHNASNDVALVQYLLNANLRRLTPLRPLVLDGRFGSATARAIQQARDRIQMASTVDAQLIHPGDALIAMLSPAINVGAPRNMTARFEELRHPGQNRQMAVGRITVGHGVYVFVSGGHGRGHLPPGRYRVQTHRQSRSEPGFSTDGVGYSFALSDAPASRVGGADRQLLRIHPDGNTTGTQGCIGILGGRQTQNRFRSAMNAELARPMTVVLTVESAVSTVSSTQ